MISAALTCTSDQPLLCVKGATEAREDEDREGGRQAGRQEEREDGGREREGEGEAVGEWAAEREM